MYVMLEREMTAVEAEVAEVEVKIATVDKEIEDCNEFTEILLQGIRVSFMP